MGKISVWLNMLWISKYQVLTSVFLRKVFYLEWRTILYWNVKYIYFLQLWNNLYLNLSPLWRSCELGLETLTGLFVLLTSCYCEHVTYYQHICFQFFSMRGWIGWSHEKSSSFRKGRKTFLTQWHRLKLKVSGGSHVWFGLWKLNEEIHAVPRADIQR